MPNYTEEERLRPMEGKCNAHRADGSYCKGWPMRNGIGKCHRHGGKSVSGPVHKMFKHGRLSKHLPDRLIPKFMDAIQDGDILSLMQEVALIDTRTAELLAGLSEEDGTLVWRRMKAAKNAYQKYLASRHEGRAQEQMERIFAMIDEGASEHERWKALLELTEQRRKTVESERKRLIETQQMMTSKEAMTMLSVFMDLATKYIPTQEGRKGLAHDIDSIFNNRRRTVAQA